jgi:hypothetical protein
VAGLRRAAEQVEQVGVVARSTAAALAPACAELIVWMALMSSRTWSDRWSSSSFCCSSSWTICALLGVLVQRRVARHRQRRHAQRLLLIPARSGRTPLASRYAGTLRPGRRAAAACPCPRPGPRWRPPASRGVVDQRDAQRAGELSTGGGPPAPPAESQGCRGGRAAPAGRRARPRRRLRQSRRSGRVRARPAQMRCRSGWSMATSGIASSSHRLAFGEPCGP